MKHIVRLMTFVALTSPALAEYSAIQMVSGNFSNRWASECDSRGVCSFGDPNVIDHRNSFVLWSDEKIYSSPVRFIAPRAIDDFGFSVSLNPVFDVHPENGSVSTSKTIFTRTSIFSRKDFPIEREISARRRTKQIEIAQNHFSENLTVALEAGSPAQGHNRQPITLRFGTLGSSDIHEFARVRIARRLAWDGISKVLIDDEGNFYVEIDAGDNARSLQPRKRLREVCAGNVRSSTVQCVQGSFIDTATMPRVVQVVKGKLLASRFDDPTIHLDGRPYGGKLEQWTFPEYGFNPNSLAMSADGTIAGRLTARQDGTARDETFVMEAGSGRVDILRCAGSLTSPADLTSNEIWPMDDGSLLYLNRNNSDESDLSVELGVYRLVKNGDQGPKQSINCTTQE